jgi:2-octaprenyl-3-methyl-6-methoxy-1,4-benzoquinol hydroxylase
MKEFDCVVVGGGMVGAASALSLAALGLTVALVEKEQLDPISSQTFEDKPFDLRVSAISIASEYLLKRLGAWQQIKSWRICPYRNLAVWENESAYTQFEAKSINQEHLGHIIENTVVQWALWNEITTNKNISVYCPEIVESLEQFDHYVIVQLNNSVIKSKLVVGADGASSKIRQMANIGTTGWDYQQSAMLINVETELSQQDITWQQYLPTGPIAFLPLPSCKNNSSKDFSGYASLVWYHKRDEIKRLSLLSNNQLKKEIINNFPDRLGEINVLSRGGFPLTRRHANNYQNKRVLLLGDAAHTINPMAGQGVNLGFKDVIALQHVIAEAIGNGEIWHEQNVLTRYEKKRRNENLLMMSTMDALYASFSHPSPIAKVARNLALLAVNKVPFVNGTIKNKALAYACGL